MTTFTDKELIKEIKERIGSLDVRDNIERRAYEIALASLEADPVAYIFKHPAGKLFWALTDESNKEQADVIPVYAAPPVPVVPEEKPMPNALSMLEREITQLIGDAQEATVTGYELIAEAWRLMDGQDPKTSDWHSKASKYLNSNIVEKVDDDRIEAVKAVLRRLAGNYPVTSGRLPGGFTIEDAKELHENLVRSHISQALSGEKMKKKDRDADLRWIHGVIVQAAWFVKASLEQNALSGNSPVTPDSWISCSERTPNDAQWCVVNTKYGYYVQCWSEGQGWLGDDISIPECDVINWMPLPEPPQEAK